MATSAANSVRRARRGVSFKKNLALEIAVGFVAATNLEPSTPGYPGIQNRLSPSCVW